MNQWEYVRCTGLEEANNEMPVGRSGHSASILESENTGDYMYIFGGNTKKNKKLNDLWRLNLITHEW